MQPLNGGKWACQLARAAAAVTTGRHRVSVLRSLTAGATSPDDEIERKFAPTSKVEALVRRLASRERSTSFRDTYFDSASFALTQRDCWLRKRNSTFELKWPMRGSTGDGIDYYHESTDWTTIAGEVRRVSPPLVLAPPFPRVTAAAAAAADDTAGVVEAETWLRGSAGLVAFADILTSRTRFDVELPCSRDATSRIPHLIRVDLDAVEFGGRQGAGATDTRTSSAAHSYAIGEVELERAGGGMTPSQAMADVFAALGIAWPATTRGKVLEYLVRFRPAHYAALVECGLVASKLGGVGGAAVK